MRETNASGSIEKILQFFAAAGMAKLPQSFGFNLTDPFTGHVELLTHFLQRPGTSILKSKAETENFFLPGC